MAVSLVAGTVCALEPIARAELETETLEACRAGDPKALRRFVVRYEPLVFAYLSRTLGAGPHVEDLAQEVFLRAFRGVGRFSPEGAARASTWLLTIATRVAIDARKRRRVPCDPFPDDGGPVDPQTPETERQRLEMRQRLGRALGELAPELRDAYVLAEFHGLSMAEMSEVLGIGLNATKARLWRARERLRLLLGPWWEGRC
jgi:RNA polymerase sigma-70 factor (ECF subfamily)